MFVRSLAYSCRSSCSSGEHCGGAEARLWDVESESDDVIAGDVQRAKTRLGSWGC
jgi:hypothetical protein